MRNFLRIRALRVALPLLLGIFVHALPAAAQVTSLSMQSDTGDYIGQGQTYFYTAADGTFIAQGESGGNGVTVSFNTPSFDHFWHIALVAPNGAPLTVGTYPNAMRWPFQSAGFAGLSVSGDGRGCNELTGSFQVLQIAYGPDNKLAALDAVFEQHCEGFIPALRGQIRYNASAALYLTAPSQIQVIQNHNIAFLVTATDAQSRRVFLTATSLPPGATFNDLGNNTGSFSWTPAGNQSGPFFATFNGDNRQGNVATLTTRINVIPPPPANDDFATPVLIPSSPARYTANVTNATTAPDDPSCFGNAQSVWYAFTPLMNMQLEANTFGSGYDTTLSVYMGPRDALDQITCNDDAGSILQSRVRFSATAGKKYFFMVSSRLDPVPAANLVFNLQPAPPPFSFNPTVAQFGSVQPSTGAVTIRGSMQCSQPAYVSIFGQLKQKRGGVTITGYWSAYVPCDGVTPWTTTVQSQTALFRGRSAALFAGGKAEFAATATASDPDSGEAKQLNMEARITLRGK